jgi:hypothetical protein
VRKGELLSLVISHTGQNTSRLFYSAKVTPSFCFYSHLHAAVLRFLVLFYMTASGVDVHTRQAGGIWSYFGFNTQTTGTRNRRASSASLPTRNTVEDPFEKPDRHSSNSSDAGEFVQERAGPIAWMNHGQRARYLKWGGLITLILFVFVYLAPGERSRVGSIVGGLSRITLRSD